MKFKLITSSGFDEYTKDLLGELLGACNKPAKFADKIKSKKSSVLGFTQSRLTVWKSY